MMNIRVAIILNEFLRTTLQVNSQRFDSTHILIDNCSHEMKTLIHIFFPPKNKIYTIHAISSDRFLQKMLENLKMNYKLD